MNDILAGIDPLDLSVTALAWAADEAMRRGSRLRLLAALPPVHDRLPSDAFAHTGALRVRARSVLSNAQDIARRLQPSLSTVTELVDGEPAEVLREGTADAVLVVVGSRRLGRVAEVLSESSVSLPLTARADCPVVVVRAPEHITTYPPSLVVGVDGSPSCRAALALAVAEASLRRARLRAVWVWPRPVLPQENAAEGLTQRQRLLARSVAEWSDRHPDVEIVEDVLRGHPVEQLRLASRSALALVVGRRGRGGYTGMRVGSTVRGLLHHAECPLITVPPSPEPERFEGPVRREEPRFRTDGQVGV